ncbi:MAG: hypothetical protein KBF59_04390 [Ignavibacterium sp.]|nr:hypothetical protein [Ignavibacterium sp.]
MNYWRVVLLCLSISIIISNIYAQSITFLDKNIKIGDSFDEVFKEIDTTIFEIETSIDNMRWKACKTKTISFFDKTPATYKYYGDLVFVGCELPDEKTINYELKKVKKNWLTLFDKESNVSKILGTISDIINKSGIDNYDNAIENYINLEPDDISKEVTIKLNDWNSLSIRTRNDYYEIAEIIDENQLNNIRHKYFYVLMFFDEYDYYKFPDKLSVERFEVEEDAQMRLRELRIPYIMDYKDEKKWGRIIRYAVDDEFEFKFDNKDHK